MKAASRPMAHYENVSSNTKCSVCCSVHIEAIITSVWILVIIGTKFPVITKVESQCPLINNVCAVATQAKP